MIDLAGNAAGIGAVRPRRFPKSDFHFATIFFTRSAAIVVRIISHSQHTRISSHNGMPQEQAQRPDENKQDNHAAKHE